MFLFGEWGLQRPDQCGNFHEQFTSSLNEYHDIWSFTVKLVMLVCSKTLTRIVTFWQMTQIKLNWITPCWSRLWHEIGIWVLSSCVWASYKQIRLAIHDTELKHHHCHAMLPTYSHWCNKIIHNSSLNGNIESRKQIMLC